MSTNINITIYQNNIGKSKKKPIIDYFNHLSELDLDSKKHITASQIEHNYKNTNIFDIKNQNIYGVDFSNQQEEDKFLNDRDKSESIFSSNITNINPLNLDKSQINQNNNKNQKNKTFQLQQQNKKILRRPQKKAKQKKINNKNNKNKRNSRLSKSVINISKKSKSSNQSKSNSSQNSTKRENYLLKARNSPEKYPDDYLSIDSSENEEKEIQRKEMKINKNCASLLNKNILEKGKIINKDFSPKKDIDHKLKGFDLTSLDIKSMYRDEDFKKKYFKNFKKEIIIVYMDKEQIPLHAIFIFNEPNENKQNYTKKEQKEKKLFPGAYEKNEFIEFCSRMINAKKPVKVELLMDYAEMSKYKEFNFMEVNPYLYDDFYFLIDILY